jgi:hypothetical protein
MPKLFGADARDSGLSLRFQLGAAIGGLAPVIAAVIVAPTNANRAVWLIAVSLILVARAVVQSWPTGWPARWLDAPCDHEVEARR